MPKLRISREDCGKSGEVILSHYAAFADYRAFANERKLRQKAKLQMQNSEGQEMSFKDILANRIREALEPGEDASYVSVSLSSFLDE